MERFCTHLLTPHATARRRYDDDATFSIFLFTHIRLIFSVAVNVFACLTEFECACARECLCALKRYD